jgi:cytochrome c553
MNTTLKWIGIIVVALVVLLLAGGAVVYAASSSKLNKGPSVPVKAVPAAEGAEAIARGEHLVNAISLCADCHGQNLSGQLFIEDPAIGTVYAPNLTGGEGGAAATFSDEDWERAIRHGIGSDGRVLAVMPSNGYAHFSDADLAALLAYIQSLPPTDNVLPSRQIKLPGTILFGAVAYETLPVNNIDHAAVGDEAPQAGANAAYGEYLTFVAGCRDCHGPDLGGVDPAAAPSGPPPGPNLHASGDLGSWSQEDFIAALRTGQTPNGRQLSTEMPWESYRLMTDEELGAIWFYLHGLE